MNAPAQPARPLIYNIQSFSPANGLPSIDCFDIAQDNEGFMWIATRAGLARYDGKNFKTFTIYDGLPDNTVQAIAPAADGKVWVGTNKGLCYYYKGQIFPTSFKKEKIDFLLIHKGELWLFLRSGEVWKYAGKSFKKEYSGPGRFANRPVVMDDKIFVFQLPSGLVVLTGQTSKQIMLRDTFQNRCIQYEEGNNIRVGTLRGMINVKEDLTVSYEKYSDSLMKGISVHLGECNYLGKLENAHIFCFYNIEKYTLAKKENNFLDTIKINGVLPGIFHGFPKIFVDREANIWMLDLNGVIKLSRSDFIFYPPDTYYDTKGYSIPIYGITKQGENMVFSGPGFISFQHNDLIKYLLMQTGAMFSSYLRVGEIFSILNDGEKGLWIASSEAGLLYYNSGSKKISHPLSVNLPSNTINNIYRDNDSSLWLCGDAGLSHVIKKSVISYGRKDGLAADIIYKCYRDAYNLLWIGTNAGLFTFDGVHFKNVSALFGITASVVGLTSDGNGNMYAAVLGNGLRIIGRAANNTYRLIKQYTAPRDLRGNNILDVIIDREGKCWLLSLDGVTVIKDPLKPEKGVIFYPLSSLVTNNLHNNNSWGDGKLCLGPGNEVWAATTIGVLKFFNSPAEKLNTAIPARIVDVKIENIPVNPQSEKNYAFPYNTNLIEFTFRGVTHMSDNNVEYEYWLKGGGAKDWSVPNTNDRITFDNLAPGEYSFLVRAKLSSSNEWSGTPTEFHFQISPPWWRTGWAYFIYGLLLVLLIWLIIRFIVKIKEEKLKKEKETLFNEIRVLQAQLNPHFLFNTLTSLTELIYSDPAKAETFVENLSGLSRYILVNKDKEVTSLEEELLFLNDYLCIMELKYGSALNVAINIPDEYKSKQIVPMVTQLLIENCLKHNATTPQTPLFITINADADWLVVENNINEKKLKSFSSNIGLPVIQKKYAVLCSRKIEIIKSEDKFIVRIPLI